MWYNPAQAPVQPPPLCVFAYGRLVAADATASLIEHCLREVLRLVGRASSLRAATGGAAGFNITFYTNNNFIASRDRLRQCGHITVPLTFP